MRPDFCRTLRPGSSTVPRALAVMFEVFKASMQTVPKRRVSAVVASWFQCLRARAARVAAGALVRRPPRSSRADLRPGPDGVLRVLPAPAGRKHRAGPRRRDRRVPDCPGPRCDPRRARRNRHSASAWARRRPLGRRAARRRAGTRAQMHAARRLPRAAMPRLLAGFCRSCPDSVATSDRPCCLS